MERYVQGPVGISQGLHDPQHAWIMKMRGLSLQLVAIENQFPDFVENNKNNL